VALSLADGKMLWSVQDTPGDAWVVGCIRDTDKENCPRMPAQITTSVLRRCCSTFSQRQERADRRAEERQRVGPRSRPQGRVVWKTAVFSKPPEAQGQIVWGGTADDAAAYFGLNSGGIVSLALDNGERRWRSPMQPAEGRKAGEDAAISSIPGYIFSGGWDGILRILSSRDGKVVWSFDMAQEFKTVNGVPAKGGSMGSAGPTNRRRNGLAGAGYPGVQNGANGNVLLAFGQ